MPMDRERARRGRSRGDRAVTEQTVIRIMCPNLGCQRVLAVPDHARGKLVRCRSCGTNIRIPAERPLPSLDPEPLEMPEPQEGLEGEG